MSVSIGGKIVTDGLILHYDALNGKSYPGSGDTWIDLTSYTNNGNLNAGDNTTTIANGYASFLAGYNSCVDINDIAEVNNTTLRVTVDMWVKINPTLVNHRYLFGWEGIFIIVRSNDIPSSIGTGANYQDLYGANTLNDLGVINNWAHYSIVMVNSRADQGNLPISDNKVYINSVNQSLSQLEGDPYLNSRVFSFSSVSDARIGGRRGGIPFLISDDLEIAIVKVYNRELTQTEVTQNFNAHKGRFNIY